MATSSILSGEPPPIEPTGTDDDSLGPSDSSDSGSDALVTRDRVFAEAGLEEPANADIVPDRISVVLDYAHEASSSIGEPDAVSVDELASEAVPEDGDTDDRENA